MAFFTGAGICLTAYLLQNLTRNPLTSEYTLGISAGASFFASLGLILSLSPILFSLMGGVGITFLLFFALKGKIKGTSLILLGIVLNIAFSSGISFINFLTAFKSSQSLSRWIFGGFSFYRWEEVFIVGALAILTLILCIRENPRLTLISISETYEEILGKAFKKKILLLLILSGSFISVSTTFAGPIPFYALLVANFIRQSLGGNPLGGIMVSFTAGGFILAALDTLSRLISPIEEIPLGVITGLAGIPFMTLLLWKERIKN